MEQAQIRVNETFRTDIKKVLDRLKGIRTARGYLRYWVQVADHDDYEDLQTGAVVKRAHLEEAKKGTFVFIEEP